MLNLAGPLIICSTYFSILILFIKLYFNVMFMCCKNDSSVLNSIYSGQQLISYICYQMKKLYLKYFALEADFVVFFVVVPVWLLITAVTASNVITLLALVVKENSRKPLVANIAKVFGILVFCEAIVKSTIKFN